MLILAHRGYRAKYPENTLLSFEKAIEFGADGIELDVRKSSDDVLVVFHDPYVELDGDYKIILHTDYHELSKIDLGEGERMPTFSDVLECLKKFGNRVFLDVEVKLSELIEPVFELLQDVKYENFMISSFMRESIFQFWLEHPKVPVGFIFSENELSETDPLDLILDELENMGNVKGLHIILPMKICDEYVLSELPRIKERFKVKLGVWDVNNEEQFRRVENIADLVITDEVEKIVKLRGNPG